MDLDVADVSRGLDTISQVIVDQIYSPVFTAISEVRDLSSSPSDRFSGGKFCQDAIVRSVDHLLQVSHSARVKYALSCFVGGESLSKHDSSSHDYCFGRRNPIEKMLF